MGIMDLVNVNYKQLFGKVLQNEEAQSLMADFLNHCIINCRDTSDALVEALSNNENFEKLVDKSVTNLAKKEKMKTDFFSNHS